ncbi:MAG: 50S ribosomal protein L4 [Patescibacteria group bacterium]|nr:50S ribosomal protein L4 [Patescibacteria group bacterium]
MKADVFNQKNHKVDTIEISDRIFNAEWNPELVHQVYVAQMSSARKPLAHTKDRSDVAGGGKKPWRQKHTGRSRHSSIRSPLWAGGGVTFGPTKERIFYKKVNKKMKKGAIFSLLSRKLVDDEIRFIDDLNIENNKTKNVVLIMKSFFKKSTSALFIVEKNNKNIFMAARNIPRVKVLNADSLNIVDCLVYKHIFFDKAAVPQLDKLIFSRK